MKPTNNDRFTLLLRVYPMLMNKLMQGYKPIDIDLKLNHTQWKTLFILSFMQKPHMSQMSKSMNMEKGSLTSVVDELIRKGLVNRTQDESDRRKVLIELTPQSKKIVEKGRQNLWNHIMTQLNNLEESDISKLFNALAEIMTIVEKL